jgi:hypothetical protein
VTGTKEAEKPTGRQMDVTRASGHQEQYHQNFWISFSSSNLFGGIAISSVR